jgi:ammonium transporter Rh
MYQDVNVMILVGFGFLMTYIKLHAWSSLAYTFFINAITVQLYILLSNFWERLFNGTWDSPYIYIKEKSFASATFSVAPILIAFGVVIGKVGPLEFLTMGLVSIVGYSLN